MSTKNDPEKVSNLLERSIEALLFASDTPLSVNRLMSITGASSTKEIKTALESIDGFYREQRRSFEIVEVAGGYQITTLPEFADVVAQLFKSRRKSRLSQPALETLAIIAYKQPISRVDIEAIRGVNSEGVLSTLVERELVAISGRGEGLGRPFLYSTTRKFLEYLGLKDHKDLPDMEELERSFTAEQMQIEKMTAPDGAEREGENEGGESEQA
ncbi:MAG TPA: SMC-Scp complex subunit ScpB [Candidatus Eisenbacteria bacterium]|uniref:SMC-Scp complex subunit ScpB n=1 Tax=Eiseniibacteriota bacterium TaxID=2212470 RepID=A0A7V2AUS7_UNCEI|nr:SMC-Scp complex subunit ScpB [Candidatus Eisenbacteria bacterium]